MKATYDFAFKVSAIATAVFLFIEWRAPGFVSYAFPFPWLIFATALFYFLSTNNFKPKTMSCIFCEIVAGNIPALKIYENDKVIAFLDINPVAKGHTLVIPKNHANDLAAGSVEDSLELMKVIHDLAPKIVKAVGASGYNLGMNHGFDAGQEVLHTHIHIMPRYNGDVRSFVKTHPVKEELQAVADEIRAKL
ncbi:MAG: HIT family protein [Patescibacteria group bacterium]|jgi:histidine triad (HIT) family protein